MAEQILLTGSYGTPGLNSFVIDTHTFAARHVDALAVPDTSFFAAGADGTVFVVREGGREDSQLFAVKVDGNGTMTVKAQAPCGYGPCFVAVAPDGRFVATADYGGGTVTVYAVADNGLQIVRSLTFGGSGPVERRQASPHPHCVCFAPDGRHVFVTDLGADRIYRYAAGGDCCFADTPDTVMACAPGSGPRHLVFDARGLHAYLVNEIADTVTVFDVDAQNNLTPVQTIAADTAGAHGAGHIALSDDGRFLHVSLRLKHEGIATFAADPVSGRLTHIAHTAAGAHPRHFAAVPGGRHMLVSCRDAACLQVFEVDAATGIPKDTGRSIAVPRPVCARVCQFS